MSPSSSASTLTSARTEQVPIKLINIPNNYPRQVDADWVSLLAEAMREAGQLQAIRLVEQQDGQFELSFGLQRLMAADALGWETIRADIVPAADIEGGRKRVSTLFENLVRQDFNALERALALAELKDIHEQLYPETKHGGDQKKNQALRDQNAKLAFWWEAAERTGLSERAIVRSIAIAKGLTEPNITRVRGSWLAHNQAQLQSVAALPFAQQDAVLNLLLKDPPEVTSVADALELLRNGKLAKPEDKAFSKLVDNLARMKPAARERLFITFESEILAWAATRLEMAGK